MADASKWLRLDGRRPDRPRSPTTVPTPVALIVGSPENEEQSLMRLVENKCVQRG
jgi:hypothetical protein